MALARFDYLPLVVVKGRTVCHLVPPRDGDLGGEGMTLCGERFHGPRIESPGNLSLCRHCARHLPELRARALGEIQGLNARLDHLQSGLRQLDTLASIPKLPKAA